MKLNVKCNTVFINLSRQPLKLVMCLGYTANKNAHTSGTPLVPPEQSAMLASDTLCLSVRLPHCPAHVSPKSGPHTPQPSCWSWSRSFW